MFELSSYHVMLAAIGVAIILAYWLPRFVSGREPAASALLIGFGLLAFGFVPGMPAAVTPLAAPIVWETVSTLCVITGLFGVGLRIDRPFSMRLWRPTIRLLVIAMPLTIAVVAIAGWFAASMTLAGAILLGAILAPTDPVLASDVQVGPPLEGGEHPVRFALTAEAGLNDGLAFPFLYLALAIAATGAVTPDLLFEWLWRDIGYKIGVGVLSGIGIGWLLGKLLFDWPRQNPLADTGSGVVAFAGVLVAYGITELLEGYGFIAVFLAGITVRHSESRHDFHTQLHDFSESIERALTAILLVGLGAAIPALLPGLRWSGFAIAALLIFVFRPLAGWLSLWGALPRSRERAVVSFYGVRGIGSINYLAYAGGHIQLVNIAELWAIVACTIILSTIVHGFTAGIAVERATGEPATS